MHKLLANNKRALAARRSSTSKSTSIPRISFVNTRSTSSSSSSSTALSRSTSSTQNTSISTHNAAATLSTDQLDCFRSMRGTSTASISSLESAMSADLTELDDRLATIRAAGEREKKVFDAQGQAYSILVTHEEVRVCHVDDKGEYHYRHLPNIGGAGAPGSSRVSRTASRRPSRRTSNAQDEKKPTGLHVKDGHGLLNLGRFRRRDAKNKATSASKPQVSPQQPQAQSHLKSQQVQHPPRRQIVQDTSGRVLVDITPDTVTVHHRSGVWRCHRFAGKIWDSDYKTHVTAKMPRPWQKLRRRRGPSAADDSDKENNKDNDNDNVVEPELLLASNTPGERGPPPRAFKSFYHDL